MNKPTSPLLSLVNLVHLKVVGKSDKFLDKCW